MEIYISVDVSFFGMPEEKDWVLVGHIVNRDDNFYSDRTLMYYEFGYTLVRKMGRYASRTEFVEVEINREYFGVYVFMEKLKRDTEQIDITMRTPGNCESLSISGGYILSIIFD